jgi:putative acetyltransferase
MQQVTLRHATIEDCDAIRTLFRDTIRTVNVADYDAAQIAAWSKGWEIRPPWEARINYQYFLLAEIEGVLVGFCSLEPDGHLDLLYVHAAHQGQGIAHILYHAIEAEAKALGLAGIYSEVSITARTFFERQGFTIVTPQTVHVRGVDIINYQMRKALP